MITYKVSGEAVISSEIIENKRTGFSFSEQNLIIYPNSNNIIPDIFLQVNTAYENGNIDSIYVFLSGVGLTQKFYLVESFSTSDSARTYFDSLLQLPNITNMLCTAFPLQKNQIWAIKTNQNKYAKILVLEKYIDNDQTNIKNNDPYCEVKFLWHYNPNGTNNFN